RGRIQFKGLDEPVHVLRVDFDLDLPAGVDAAGSRSRVWLLAVAGVVALVIGVGTFVGTRFGCDTASALSADAVAAVSSSRSVSSETTLPRGGRPAGMVAGAGAIWATEAGGSL